MRVLVTGGSGRLGRWTVCELLAHGHEVEIADRRPPVVAPGLERLGAAGFREVDLGDVGQVAGALAGCDAVAHLGAIPSPGRHPDEIVFANNTGGTFAVLQAATLLGVRKAVVASSLSALGNAWAYRPFPPLYAPVDEDHPLLSQDPYGLSKEVDERICAAFHRRIGMQVLALRFHTILGPGEMADWQADRRAHGENAAHLLWGYVDVRDAAAACRLGLEAEGLGCEVFNITAADTFREEPTEELIRRHCPTVELRRPIAGTATAFSIDKARRLLGYAPRHGWRAEG